MSEEIRIAVCEDYEEDKNSLVAMIADYLDQNDLVAKIDSFSTGEDFLSHDVSAFSLVFLDIYMDQLDGMETAKRLIEANKSVQLVFCSSTRDYAAESYDVSALYYLVKPVEKEKINKALDYFFNGMKHLKNVSIKVGRTEETVYLQDIIYAESDNKKTILHTEQGKLSVSMPFSYFVQELAEPDFVKPIRYALVAVNRIVKVPSKTVILSDGTELPVSRTMRQHVKDVFSHYKWKSAFAVKGERE